MIKITLILTLPKTFDCFAIDILNSFSINFKVS